MEDKSFELLLNSMSEMEEHMHGNLDLKSTIIEVLEVPDMTASMVRELRDRLGVTQRIFAEIFGVSLRAVETWEEGKSKPNGSARRLMSLLNDEDLSKGITHKVVNVG